MAYTDKQTKIMIWLQDNHFGEWLNTRKKIEIELSDQQIMFCCCGKLASSLHENCCRKFQEKVSKATINELKHLYNKENNHKD